MVKFVGVHSFSVSFLVGRVLTRHRNALAREEHVAKLSDNFMGVEKQPETKSSKPA